MNSYEPKRPRTTIALAAVALTAITIGMFVVAPAKFDNANPELRVLATTKGKSIAPTEVAISPARIEVVGVREAEVASVELGRHTLPAVNTR